MPKPDEFNFNPRTPRGVRRARLCKFCKEVRFQSTHPARGATVHHVNNCNCFFISIHAPREGCDNSGDGGLFQLTNFNPRTPRGVRLLLQRSNLLAYRFQSTHPARGATAPCCDVWAEREISIHAPREGCDRTPSRIFIRAEISIHAPREGCDDARLSGVERWKEFQSTHPARGATANFTKEQRVCLAQFAYLHKGKKAEHTKTNAPMLH